MIMLPTGSPRRLTAIRLVLNHFKGEKGYFLDAR